MTPVERDLKEIGEFIPGFFGLLGVVVASLPFADKLLGALPTVLRHHDIASILASLAAFALIGGHFVSKMSVLTVEDKLPTGAVLIAAAVVLSVGYLGVADFMIRGSIQTGTLTEIGLIVWYVAIYASLTMGLWQMAYRAYKTKDKETKWGPFT